MYRPILTFLALVAASPLCAQVRDDADEQPPLSSTVDADAGRTASTGTGTIGQRQTRAESVPNFRPLGRIQGRIASRVQNRIRNRIDRTYDPQANATLPFEVANDQARTAGERPR